MKTRRLAVFVTAFSLAAFSSGGCAEKEKSSATAAPKAVAAAPGPVAVAAPAPAATQWSDIKGFGYDQRDQVLGGLKGLEARVDEQITELNAKRATLDASNTSTQAWDLAMKEMGEARMSLKSAGSDLAAASRDTWDQLKDKVGAAWDRTQTAYAKVKASTTK